MGEPIPKLLATDEKPIVHEDSGFSEAVIAIDGLSSLLKSHNVDPKDLKQYEEEGKGYPRKPVPRGTQNLLEALKGQGRFEALSSINTLIDACNDFIQTLDFESNAYGQDAWVQQNLFEKIYEWRNTVLQKMRTGMESKKGENETDVTKMKPHELSVWLVSAAYSIKIGKQKHVDYFREDTQRFTSVVIPLLEKKIHEPGYESCATLLEQFTMEVEKNAWTLKIVDAITKKITSADSVDEPALKEWQDRYGPGALTTIYGRSNEILQNLNAMKELEVLRPGMPKSLDEKGIRQFDKMGSYVRSPLMGALQFNTFDDKQLDRIFEKILSSEELDHLQNNIDLLLRAGSIDSIARVAQFLKNNEEFIIQSITQMPEKARAEYFSLVLNMENVWRALEQKLEFFTYDDDTKKEYPAPSTITHCATILNTTLAHYGIDFLPLVESWRSNITSMDLKKNLEVLAELEKKRPGSIKVLVKEYGIRNFCRYPIDLLIRQYDQRNDTSLKYGIIVNPTNDYNGAFLQDIELWKKLSDDLQQSECTIRVMEADGKIEIARHLLRADKRYGISHKIEFAFLGGHGSKDSISFGGNDSAHSLKSEDLSGRGVQKTKHFFVENPTIVLASCSTGTAQGLGEKLSETMGAIVLAPDRPTSLKSIAVVSKKTGITFEVEFQNKDASKTYGSPQGSLLKDESIAREI